MKNVWAKIGRYADAKALVIGTTAKTDVMTFFLDGTFLFLPMPRFENDQ